MEQTECECPCECPLEVNYCTGDLLDDEDRYVEKLANIRTMLAFCYLSSPFGAFTKEFYQLEITFYVAVKQ